MAGRFIDVDDEGRLLAQLHGRNERFIVKGFSHSQIKASPHIYRCKSGTGKTSQSVCKGRVHINRETLTVTKVTQHDDACPQAAEEETEVNKEEALREIKQLALDHPNDDPQEIIAKFAIHRNTNKITAFMDQLSLDNPMDLLAQMIRRVRREAGAEVRQAKTLAELQLTDEDKTTGSPDDPLTFQLADEGEGAEPFCS